MNPGAAAPITAVIAAAGSGERLGAGGPKAFVPLAGRPMVEWSLLAFRAAGVAEIVVAVPPEAAPGTTSRPDEIATESSSRYPDVGKLGPDCDSTTFVAGGATRAESVSNALQVVQTELVAIHDAARPLVTPSLIEGVVQALLADPDAAGVIAAAPVIDTIKRASGVPDGTSAALAGHTPVNAAPVVGETLDRAELWAAQTPQAFRAEALRAALSAASAEELAAATDEAMLVEAAGNRVLIHPAPAENLKVTTPFDLAIADRALQQR